MQQTQSKMSDSVLSKSIPVQRTDLSTFDDSFSFLREKFTAEMRRMDEEMNKFSADLQILYGQFGQSSGPAPASPATPGPGAAGAKAAPVTWESLATSPLIQGEGDDKVLKLQFDLGQFDPSEIKVQIIKDFLIVSASHQEKTDNSSVLREFKREFVLPKGTDPNAVISSLSRDGVLTVQAPLPVLHLAMEEKSASLVVQPASPRDPQSPLGPQTPQRGGSKMSKGSKK